jgi:hypothetical protein
MFIVGRNHSRIVAACIAIVICLSTVAISQTQSPKVVHVIVALADNTFQGIVPVPRAIGNGDDFERNLYWGAAFGVKNFFRKSAERNLVGPCTNPAYPVLERCVFRHEHSNVVLVADAYRGREIKKAIEDFFAFCAGRKVEQVSVAGASTVTAGGGADLIAYVGHDGLMDFRLNGYDTPVDKKLRDAIVLACASKQFFANGLTYTSAKPLLWTTGLMAPEAYVLEAALAGWTRNESGEQIRDRAAKAYNRYQKCGDKAAHHLFATGW